MRPLIVFVDVDDTLIRSFGTKRIPMPHVVDHVRELAASGARLYCWSSGGADYARASAIELDIEDLFEGFVPKPNVMVDDVDPKDWPSLIVRHPATVRGVTFRDYREQVFPEDRSLTALSAVEHVRKRPGMYVGDVGQLGLNHLVFWLLRDSFAPLPPQTAPRVVRARLLAPNRLELCDDQRHRACSKEAIRALAEQFGEPSPSPFVLGDFVVANALSERFELELWSDGEGWAADYEKGVLVRGPIATSGHAGSGTRVRLEPDPSIFTALETGLEFDADQLARRLDELAALHAGIEASLETKTQTTSWKRPGGLADWIQEWEPRPAPAERVFRGTLAVGELRCEVAWRWVEGSAPQLRSWVNSVETKDGGSHARAFVRSVRAQAHDDGQVLVGAVHVTLPHPRFKSPIKSELDVPEVGAFVKATVHAARLDSPG